MYSTETEIYSLATCPGTKYSGDTITLRATPRDGIGPYYVAFKKDGIIIDPSRLGGESNPILNAPENIEIIKTYTLDDVDVSNALTGTIDFSVFIRGSCPTGGGLQFDGVDDYTDAGNAASLNFGTGEFTVKFLMHYTGNTAVNNVYSSLTKTGSMTNTPGYWIGVTTYGGDGTNLKLLSSITNGGWGTGNIENGNFFLPNTWQDIVFVRSGTILKHYRNGIPDGIVNIVGAGANVDNALVQIIGANFTGTLDEVHIYNRALSPTEILGLYNGSTPRNGLVLEHIYSLGNANDLSGYGNNGIPINGPVFIPNACMDTCTVAIGCIAPVCNFVVT